MESLDHLGSYFGGFGGSQYEHDSATESCHVLPPPDRMTAMRPWVSRMMTGSTALSEPLMFPTDASAATCGLFQAAGQYKRLSLRPAAGRSGLPPNQLRRPPTSHVHRKAGWGSSGPRASSSPQHFDRPQAGHMQHGGTRVYLCCELHTDQASANTHRTEPLELAHR